MKIGIIGLGLIGGSLAKALQYHTPHTVLGTDVDREALLKAKLVGAIDAELTLKTVPDCDLLIFSLYPQATVDCVTQYADSIKAGTMVLDTCGVKRMVCEKLFSLAAEKNFRFFGAHPMAGLHFSGFSYADVDLFHGASMVVTPPQDATIAELAALKTLFLSIGFSNMQISNPEEHDRIIAYTSQLAHIVSNAYVKSPQAKVHQGFSAGSYKDLTRVAKLNAQMWTELFLDNRENLLAEVDGLLQNLQQYADALRTADAGQLQALLQAGSDRKEEIDGQYRA